MPCAWLFVGAVPDRASNLWISRRSAISSAMGATAPGIRTSVLRRFSFVRRALDAVTRCLGTMHGHLGEQETGRLMRHAPDVDYLLPRADRRRGGGCWSWPLCLDAAEEVCVASRLQEKHGIWRICSDSLDQQRQLQQVVISPQRGFTLGHALSRRNIIPVVGPVIDAMQ